MKKLLNLHSLLCCVAALALLTSLLLLTACSGCSGSTGEPETDSPAASSPSEPPEDSTRQTDETTDGPEDEPTTQTQQPSSDETEPSEGTSQPEDDNRPSLYNPDGTPDIPVSDPSVTFDIPGFVPMEKVSLGEIGSNLSIAAVGLYSGPYFEDGTDDEVSNVLAMVVENKSDDIVELAELCLMRNGEAVPFKIAAFPGHSYCLVLASDRHVGRADDALPLPSVEACGKAMDVVLDYSPDFAVYPAEGVINVMNVSGKDINGDVYLVFKQFAHNVYLGGIAYRATFHDGVAADAIGQSIQRNFHRDSSVILYMIYPHE